VFFNYLGSAYDEQCIIGTPYSLINCLNRLIRRATVNHVVYGCFDLLMMKDHILTLSCLFLLLFLAPDVHLKPLPVVTHPVLLLPGLTASQIEARLDKESAPHFFCSRKHDWYRILLAPTEFVPKVLDCFIDNFRLIFNEKTGRTENPPGVETRVPGFGQTEQIEYLSSLKFGPGMIIMHACIC
jgi:hypothetical protein